MAESLPPLRRRRLLGVIAGLASVGAGSVRALAAPRSAEIPARSSASEPFPPKVVLLAAGPDDGRMDRWGRLLAPPLERALPPGCTLQVGTVGGIDGVTGANQFEARTPPDGSTTLLVPGSAALAWLAGDPRAQFDAGRWVPVLVASTPGVLMGRPGLAPLGRKPKVRTGSAGPTGMDMPALLALDLQGVPIVPVPAITDAFMARQAFAKGEVDVLFLRGSGTPELVAHLARQGAQPLFSLGALDASGAMIRDPLLPDVPTLTELQGATAPVALFEAWRAAATATQMEFGLMLPQLTPASSIALWRRAGEQAGIATPVREACTADAVRPIAAPAAATLTTTIAADANALLALRHWLSTRFHWQPT